MSGLIGGDELNVRTKVKRAFSQIGQKRSTDPIGIWLAGGNAKDILVPEGYVSLKTNPEVQICAHRIADLVSTMTIYLMQNTEKGDVRVKNELSRMLDISPNKYMTKKNFIYKIVHTMILEGEGNCVISPEYQKQYLRNLTFWNMDSVNFRESDYDYIIEYKGKKFDHDEVLHFVLRPSQDSPFVGAGYASILKEVVKDLAQEQATKNGFLKSKWKPSIIIKVLTDAAELMDPDKRDKLLESYVGDTEAGKPWLIPADEIDVKEVRPLNLNDLAIIDTMKLDRAMVASAFGIPPFLLGIGKFDKDEYNNFINSVILPIAKNIEQELTRKLLFSEDYYFKFNPRALFQYDLKELAEVAEKLVAMAMMHRNDARGWFDLPPEDGLDEYVLLENYIPFKALGAQKKLANQVDTKKGDDNSNGEGENV